MNIEELGARFKKIIEGKGLSHREVGLRMGHKTGTWVTGFCNGKKKNPRLNSLTKAADAVGLSLIELLCPLCSKCQAKDEAA